ncbi:TetR/AcrR family transcriptional regulator [Seohaeicola saemankumensis]|uniref:TetR/AcrR family transcriptional regulator n=1 Tax=Seohaeicola TaxID=481178 RepID=UPI0007F3FB49|nr:hypothetical protein A8B83_18970 [Rhodobacteraceae bacterium EhC02]
MQVSTKSKKPLQKRSHESRLKILNAAEKLFAESGYRATKVSDIISASGCSAGSFYHQFKDKREVAEILYSRYIAFMEQTIDHLVEDIQEGEDIRSMFTRVLSLALIALSSHVGARAAVVDLSHDAPEIAERGYQLTNRFLSQMRDKFDVFHGQIGHPDPTVAIENALQLNLIVLTQHTLRPRKYLPKENEALIGVLVDAACGILKLSEPGAKA